MIKKYRLHPAAAQAELQEAASAAAEHKMKISYKQLRSIIKEALEVHQVPVDLDTVDSEEAYGIGYMRGAEQDPDSDDDGFLSVAEIVDMTHDITDDVDESRPGLSAKFAKEAESKSAALSATAHFSDVLQLGGDHIPDDILSNIYKELLGLARDAKK
jgi:hypothetical protein